jgi:Flp pilus assembly protein TadD
VIRKMATLASLVLMLSPVLAAQGGGSAATRAMDTGKEYLRRDEFGMAIQSFTKYIALESEKSFPYDLRACTYLKMDSLDLALKDIAKSQQIDADEQTGYSANWLNGIALLLEADSAGADGALSKAARGSPSIAGFRIARARQFADSLVGGDGITEQSSERYRTKLAGLLLDEYIDRQLFGER